MAIALENLIDLTLLAYYDNKLKNWVANRMKEISSSTKFVTGELPEKGEEDILYVTEEGIKVWDPETEEYKTIASDAPSRESDVWGMF